MSRQLPPRPSLEFLKNEAKTLLTDLQRRAPDSQLADALHSIAREYGFDSWPKLKAHVESLPVAPPVSLAGTWVADFARSKPHPDHPLESATVHVTVDGDAITFQQHLVDPSGQRTRSTNTVVADGVERVIADRYTVIARWTSRRVLEVVTRLDGQIVGRGTYELSADGKTATFAAHGARDNADGWASDDDQRVVFDRVE